VVHYDGDLGAFAYRFNRRVDRPANHRANHRVNNRFGRHRIVGDSIGRAARGE